MNIYNPNEMKVSKTKNRSHIVIIIAVCFLMVIFLALVFVYFGIRNDNKKSGITTEVQASDNQVVGNSNNTVSINADTKPSDDSVEVKVISYDSVISDLANTAYGFNFTALIRNSDNVLGNILSQLYTSEFVFAEGTIFQGGIVLTLYDGSNSSTENMPSKIYINETGTYACAEYWFDAIPGTSVEDTYGYFDKLYDKNFVRIADGTTGYDLMTAYSEAISVACNSEETKLGSSDNVPAISTKGELIRSSKGGLSSNILNRLSGDFLSSISCSGDIGYREGTLIIDATNLNCNISFTEENMFVTPIEYSTISLEEYKQILNTYKPDNTFEIY